MSDRFPTPRPARPLTPDEQDERIAGCAALDNTIKAGLRAGREAMWTVARAAYEFDEMAGWSALGYESKTAWLAQPEVDMSESTYYRLVGAWRELVVLRKVDENVLADIDVTKVDVVLPAVRRSGADLGDALEDAKALSQRALREKYRPHPLPSTGETHDEPENATTADVTAADAATPTTASIVQEPAVVLTTTDDVWPCDVQAADAAPWSDDPFAVGEVAATVMTLDEALEIADRESADMPRRWTLIEVVRVLAAEIRS